MGMGSSVMSWANSFSMGGTLWSNNIWQSSFLSGILKLVLCGVLSLHKWWLLWPLRQVFITLSLLSCVHMNLQVYASLMDWKNGEHAPKSFTADVYMDIYHNHCSTLETICTQFPAKYANILADLYSASA